MGLYFILCVFQILFAKIISQHSFSNSLSYLTLFSKFTKKKHNIHISFNNNENYLKENIPEEIAENIERDSFRGKLFSIVREELDLALKNKTEIINQGVNDNCLNFLNYNLLGHNNPTNLSDVSYIRSGYHMCKFGDDSSKSFNYLAPYDSCMLKTYKFNGKYNSSTFVVMIVNKNPNLNFLDEVIKYDNYFLLALCLPQQYDEKNKNEICSDEDYRILIDYVNRHTGNFFPFNKSNLEIFTLRDDKVNNDYDSWYYLNIVLSLIPVILLLLQILFIIYLGTIYSCLKSNQN